MRRRLACCLVLASSITSANAEPRATDFGAFRLVVPAGYVKTDAKGLAPGSVELQSSRRHRFVPPTLVLQHAPIAGGTHGDPTECANAGKALAAGNSARLDAASLVEGPLGKTCQIRLALGHIASIVTELNRPGETWLFTCNHDEGDAAAETACLTTLATFRFPPPPPPKRP